ncbi:MFS transporter [Marinobacter orientalis]|uniref:MFS transporter n=1 Tax=Marinobacter orientalis TaxID=1928859 RepID=A0A7Y0NLI3_9GAMM|nr:MFS transporter [Marinobacter orientalis]NMT62708.1 MFS transporter [Marinobacter orientalis]TGX51393.1 MFS transporter [Marinobacter orientalis]
MTQELSGQRSAWFAVSLVFLAGVAAALQVGKAPVALPLLRQELDLTLVAAGWIVAIFSLLAGIGGLFSGMTVDRFGYRRTLTGGLALIVAASAWGASSQGFSQLLASRLIEGVGFLLVSTSGPRIISILVSGAQQRMAMGIWSAYMPVGVSLMLLSGPMLLGSWGWRGLWWGNSILVGAVLVAVLAVLPPGRPGTRSGGGLGDLRVVVTSPGPLLLAACFAGFTFQHLALIGFLPTLLIDQYGHSTARAAELTALVMLANAGGGVSAGWLLGRGVSRAGLIAGASVCLAVAAWGLVNENIAGSIRFLCAVAISGVGGLIPGAVIAGITVHSPGPQRVGSVTGLVVQGSQLGQFAGPAVVSWLVAWSGDWQFGAWAMIAAAMLTAMLAIPLGWLEHRLGARQEA